jgi:hypothetical protein
MSHEEDKKKKVGRENTRGKDHDTERNVSKKSEYLTLKNDKNMRKGHRESYTGVPKSFQKEHHTRGIERAQSFL